MLSELCRLQRADFANQLLAIKKTVQIAHRR